MTEPERLHDLPPLPSSQSPLMRGDVLAWTLRRLAIEAGAAIMEIYGREERGVETKADASPVTDADRAADAILVAGLEAAYPDIPVVTEERTETHSLGAGVAHFLVDPLDGTKEFVRRQGEFTVNIALIENGRPVAGVVYAPARKRLFRTSGSGGVIEERGGFDPETEGEVRPITAAEADMRRLRVVASKSHRDADTDAYIAAYEVADILSAGSSLKFCLVAAGEADLYPRLGPTMEWDTAAGQAVLEAAGGRVLRFDDLQPLVYGRPDRRNPRFVACGRDVALTGS